MKRLLFLNLLLLVFISFTSCKEKAASKVDSKKLEIAKERDAVIGLGAPEITFEETVHEFGTVNEGDVIEDAFVFENTGKTDLVITNAKASCGCTVPDWTREPIKPGDKGEVKFKFDTRGKPNKQSKTITLTTNTEKGRETLTIKGFVTPKAK